MFLQRSIKNRVSILGKGLHNGKKVKINLLPAPPDTGIVFIRTDIKGNPKIEATIENVFDGTLATSIIKNNAQIKTIEHFLSALYALGIDNLFIELNSDEIPIMDGSARPFMYIITGEAKIKEQKAIKKFIKITKHVEVHEGDKYLSANPLNTNKTILEFHISFPYKIIGEQSYTLHMTTKNYYEEISKARTFGFEDEVLKLQEMGLAKGGNLENSIVVNKFGILNDGELRYNNEFVRHKILDLVGDLYLIGHPILGKITARKSGHSLNHKLIEKIMEEKAYELTTLQDKEALKIFNSNNIKFLSEVFD